jgi:hypothetical protein
MIVDAILLAGARATGRVRDGESERVGMSLLGASETIEIEARVRGRE